MNFTPKSEEECNSFKLLPKGEYQFTINKAVDKISKNGNEMIEVVIDIWEGDRVTSKIFDYLLEEMAFKLRHCCASVGLLEVYNSGKLSADQLEGLSGVCIVDIQKGTGQYKDKNIIKDYIPRKENISQAQPQPFSGNVPLPPDSDLPF